MNKTEISTAKFAVAAVLIALLAFSGGYLLNTRFETRRGIKDNVLWVSERFTGVDYCSGHNVISNIAENFTRDAFSRGDGMNVTKLAIGNATGTLQTKTALDAVYADPTDGTYIEGTIVEWLSGGDAAFNVTFQWTFEETVNINSTATYIGNTTFVYGLAQIPTGPETYSSGENLTVRWTYIYNAND